MNKFDRDHVLIIAAAILLLFSAMLSPIVTVGLAVVILLVAALARLLGRA